MQKHKVQAQGDGVYKQSGILILSEQLCPYCIIPFNYRLFIFHSSQIGVFLGCCLVAIIILIICAIVLGTVVITHFRFESTVTRNYYKNRGTFGQTSHEDYFKPQQYFDDRNKAGRVGLAVYICLVIIISCDVLLCTASVYVCRDLTVTHGQVLYLSY